MDFINRPNQFTMDKPGNEFPIDKAKVTLTKNPRQDEKGCLRNTPTFDFSFWTKTAFNSVAYSQFQFDLNIDRIKGVKRLWLRLLNSVGPNRPLFKTSQTSAAVLC